MQDSYRKYFDIDPEYFPQVNEAEIKEHPDLWKKFYPHTTFVKLLNNVINVLNRKEQLSLWVEGAYGTGKSHAVLTVKKLLDASKEETKEYFSKYPDQLSQDLYQKFIQIKSRDKKVLTVHRYGSSDIHNDSDLVFAIQEKITEALEEAGIENKAEGALRDAAINWLSQGWTKNMFNELIESEYKSMFSGENVDDIIRDLQSYDGLALQELMSKIMKIGNEKGFNTLKMSVDDLCNWIRSVIKENNLEAIMFVWDEFTEYFQNNMQSLTGFQKIAELSATEPFYLLIVTHNIDNIMPEGDKDWKKILDRFVSPRCKIELPENMAIQLMGQAMTLKSDPAIRGEWEEILDDLEDRTSDSRNEVIKSMKKKHRDITEEELNKIIPIHPYTALLLKNISSAFDSNQRSMFDFIKNDNGEDIKGFQWFIDTHSPYDQDNPYLTIDLLWDFFYVKGRDNLTPSIRTILDSYEKNNADELMKNEKRVFKAILLMQAISEQTMNQISIFVPNQRNIGLAFEGSDLDNNRSVSIAERLVQENYLYKRPIKGGNEDEYLALTNIEDTAKIEGEKQSIIKSYDTEKLVAVGTVLDKLNLNTEYRSVRFNFDSISYNSFEKKMRDAYGRAENNSNVIQVLIAFAKNDKESQLVGKKIVNQKLTNDNIILVDASKTFLGNKEFESYAEYLANAAYYAKSDVSQMQFYEGLANGLLEDWTKKITEGQFRIYHKSYEEAPLCYGTSQMIERLNSIDHNLYPKAPENHGKLISNMWNKANFGLGAECGITKHFKGTFNIGNKKISLDTFIGEAWNEDEYWTKLPNDYMSKIKIDLDGYISQILDKRGKISITEIYHYLAEQPYGFMPTNISAFLMGFLLRDYIDGKYMYSDGVTAQELDQDNLKSMIADCLKNQTSPRKNYRDPVIQKYTEEQRLFRELAKDVFKIEEIKLTSVVNIRNEIRTKTKLFVFPMWSVKYADAVNACVNDKEVIFETIDLIITLLNNRDQDSQIANEIGKKIKENPSLKSDLVKLMTVDNCREGMKAYLSTYHDGELINLANEVGDGENYLQIFKDKLNDDTSGWLWDQDTINEQIDNVIVEYKIIVESNKIITSENDFNKVLKQWREICSNIKISYLYARGNWGDLESFMRILYNYANSANVSKLDKNGFLKELINNGDSFNRFYSHQADFFKDRFTYLLSRFNLTNDDLNDVFLHVKSNSFLMEKKDYTLQVERIAKEFDNSKKANELHKYWVENTDSESPVDWSEKHLMPIQWMVESNNRDQAERAFNILNMGNRNVDADKIEDVRKLLDNLNLFEKLKDSNLIDMNFKEFALTENYTLVLDDMDKVKAEIKKNFSSIRVYDWPKHLKEIQQLVGDFAQSKYYSDASDNVVRAIDEMDPERVKKYLVKLAKNNMNIGLEILKDLKK